MKRWIRVIFGRLFRPKPRPNEMPKIDIAALSALWIEPDIGKSPVVYDTPHKDRRHDTPGSKREKKRAVKSEEDLSMDGEDSPQAKIDLETLIFQNTEPEKSSDQR